MVQRHSWEQLLKEKKTIVVPRLEKFGEHVNDHQIEFAELVSDRFGSIIIVEEINELQNYLRVNFTDVAKVATNNNKFNNMFKIEVGNMFK